MRTRKRVESGHIIRLPAGVPRKGWMYEYCTDLQTPEGVCEACGYPEVRYMHTLSHPTMVDFLDVGCVCAETLTDDYATPREHEQRTKNFKARLERFLEREWQVSDRGTFWMRYRGHLLWVFKHRDQSWGYAIDRQFRSHRFTTARAAQTAVYRELYGPTIGSSS